MKKKILLALLIVLGVFCFSEDVSFDSFTKAADYIKSLDNSNTQYNIKITADEKKENVVVCNVLREALTSNSDIHVSLDLSDSKLEIGDEAFSFCENLKSIVLPESLKEIGENAFSYCESLKAISIPASVTGIGMNAFAGCKNLESIALSECLKEIGENAFSYCESLNSIFIPANVTSIGKEAFFSCSNLKTVNVDGTNKVYKSIEGIVYTDEGKTLFLYPANYPLKSFEVPSNVTKIGDYAFSSCSLKSISIPASVTSIGKGAFSWCISLKTINVDSANKVYKNVDGIIYTDEGKTLFLYPAEKNPLTSFAVPANVTKVGDYAFDSCTLESIVLPGGLREIGEGAFNCCDFLKSINIPASVTSIGKCAFFLCISLESIVLPEGLKEIGEDTFSNCGLKSISIPKSVTSIGEWAFSSCKNLETITFKETHKWYATKAKDSKEKVKTVTLSTVDFSADDDFNKYFWHRAD